MPINIEMPKLSDTMTEGTVVRWLKTEGEEVEIGDIIAEIETDKATMEMEAFDEGILSKISVPEGGKAPVGSAIAILLEDGESEEGTTPAMESAPTASANTPPAAAKALESAAATVNKSQPSAPAPTDGERIKASPLAKKIAESEGVDLTAVAGTGPGGRIVKADVVQLPLFLLPRLLRQLPLLLRQRLRPLLLSRQSPKAQTKSSNSPACVKLSLRDSSPRRLVFLTSTFTSKSMRRR